MASIIHESVVLLEPKNSEKSEMRMGILETLRSWEEVTRMDASFFIMVLSLRFLSQRSRRFLKEFEIYLF